MFQVRTGVTAWDLYCEQGARGRRCGDEYVE